VFNVLALFLRHRGKLVTQDRILEQVWDGRIVSNAAVASRFASLRRALGDSGSARTMLETVPRYGHRFLPPVTCDAPFENPSAAAPDGSQRIRFARSADGTRISFATTGQGPPLLRAVHFLTHLEEDWHSPI
jgi:DNA-binding winged helix-turn-helix (wHTH) protein